MEAFMLKGLNKVLNCAVRGSDNELTRLRKRLMFILGAVGAVISFTVLPIGFDSFDKLRLAAYGWGSIVSFLCLFYLLVFKRVNDSFIEAVLTGAGLVFLMLDLNGVVNELGRSRGWPLFIILIDLCLVLNVREAVSKGIVALVIVWLLYIEFELQVGTGFFNTGIFASKEVRTNSLNCEEPPCKESVVSAAAELATKFYVFLLDFFFTRRFANEARTQQENMRSVIIASENIAESLSRFDVTSAEIIIKDASLPEGLEDAYTRIIRNLKEYKSYLPRTCLQQQDMDDESVTHVSQTDADGQQSDDGGKSLSNDFHTISKSASLRNPDSANVCETTLPISVTKRSGSFVLLNLIGSHNKIKSDLLRYEVIFHEYISKVTLSFEKRSGVIGLVQGDHVYGSFNAARKCGSHSVNAILALFDISSEICDFSSAASTGMAFCGPFGSEELKSFSTIGPSLLHATIAERIGKTRSIPIVATGGIYREVSHLIRFKLILTKTSYQGQLILLYEACSHTDGPTISVPNSEWMYQLPLNEWEVYNEVGKKYLNGAVDEARRLLATKLSLTDEEEHLRDIIERQEPVREEPHLGLDF